jgi:hypothetical protein
MQNYTTCHVHIQIDGGLPVPIIGAAYLCPSSDKIDHFCLGIVRAINIVGNVHMQWFQLPSKDADPYTGTYTAILGLETRYTHFFESHDIHADTTKRLTMTCAGTKTSPWKNHPACNTSSPRPELRNVLMGLSSRSASTKKITRTASTTQTGSREAEI